MKAMTIPEAIQRIGNALKIREYALAEKLLSRVAGKIPGNLFVLITLGNIYERSGRYEAALVQYNKAITLYPASPEAYNNLGVLYKNTGKPGEAVTVLKKALEFAGSRPDIHYNLGNVYKEQEQYDAAIAEYRKALDTDPGFIHTYNNLGIVFEKLGKYEDARSVYETGLALDRNNPRLHYNLGVLYKNYRHYREAAGEFREAIRIQPGWVDAMNNYGVVLGELDAPAEAIRMFDAVLKLEPGNIKAINNSGIIHAKTGEPDKAAACYRQAIKLDPEYYNGILNLGILLEENGYYLEALQEFAGMVKSSPYDLPLRLRYAGVLLFLERYREAIDQLKFIIKQEPQHITALRVLGSVYIRTGNFPAAVEVYNTLMALDREHHDFYYDLALFSSDKKDYGKSEARIKTYLEHNPGDVNALLLLGEIFFNQGALDKAAEIYEKLNSTHPEITKPYYYLARIYSRQERRAEAVKMFEKLITLQGTRAGYDDLDNIKAALEMYEASTARYERDPRSYLEAALLKPGDFVFDTTGTGNTGKDSPDVIAIVEAKAYDNSQPVAEAIISKGLNEPVIMVKEEEEIIDIDKPGSAPAVVELDEEPHTPLTRLLDNEELYDDSPLWKTLAAQQSLLEAQQKELEREALHRGKGGTGAGSGNPAPSLPGVPPVSSQQPSLPQPPVFNQQQPAFQQPPLSQQPSLQPGSNQQPQVFQQPVFIPQPPVFPQPPLSRQPGFIPQPPADKVPANQEQAALNKQTTGTGGNVIRQEALEAIQASMQTLAELLKDKLQVIPVPVYIPQPQPVGQVVQQNMEDKKVIAGQTAEKSEGSNLKNQIRGFLNKVRAKLDTEEVISVPFGTEKKEQVIGLLDHLVKLQAELPPGALPHMNLEDMKIRIEFLREKLAGKKGLKKKIEAMYKKAIKETAGNGSLAGIARTLDYIKRMVGYLPDNTVREALIGRIDKVMKKMPG